MDKPTPPEAFTNSQIQLASGCVVCTEAVLQGEITLGAGTVVHPRAHIIAESGPIVIGENNLIEENAYIINRQKPTTDGKPFTLTIGNANVFEIGSRCEASRVGDNNIVETLAVVGRDVEITDGCVIGAMCGVYAQETLQERTIIYGEQCLRRKSGERPAVQHSQLDYLRKVLPNYHYLVPTKKA